MANFESINGYKSSDGVIFEKLEDVERHVAGLNLLHVQEDKDSLRSWDGNSVDGCDLIEWITKHKDVVRTFINNLEE